MSAQRIGIHVEELVLHGFPPLDRHAVGEVVRVELARLVGRDGVTALGAAGELDGGRLELQAATPQAIGPEIARIVHGALRR